MSSVLTLKHIPLISTSALFHKSHPHRADFRIQKEWLRCKSVMDARTLPMPSTLPLVTDRINDGLSPTMHIRTCSKPSSAPTPSLIPHDQIVMNHQVTASLSVPTPGVSFVFEIRAGHVPFLPIAISVIRPFLPRLLMTCLITSWSV